MRAFAARSVFRCIVKRAGVGTSASTRRGCALSAGDGQGVASEMTRAVDLVTGRREAQSAFDAASMQIPSLELGFIRGVNRLAALTAQGAKELHADLQKGGASGQRHPAVRKELCDVERRDWLRGR